jgi:CRISPR/Cas system endoribonuclease Cas6 (RAMP superfamily)
LPLPHYVFPNLAKRWEGIAPPELAGIVQRRLIEDYTLEDGVIITDYDLHPHRIHFTRHVQQGFVGRCTYRVHDAQSGLIANDDADEGDRESARSPLSIPQQLWLLSQLAFYTGIGYKTSMGMGRAQTV